MHLPCFLSPLLGLCFASVPVATRSSLACKLSSYDPRNFFTMELNIRQFGEHILITVLFVQRQYGHELLRLSNPVLLHASRTVSDGTCVVSKPYTSSARKDTTIRSEKSMFALVSAPSHNKCKIEHHACTCHICKIASPLKH